MIGSIKFRGIVNMKKVVIFGTFILFLVLSALVFTLVNARSRLSPSQKQEILEVLGQIRSHKEELKEAEKERDDLYNGEDELFNNNSFVIELQKENEDILASPAGQCMGRKIRGWEKTDQTKPLFDFFNEEEFESFKRITQIGNELEDMFESRLEGKRFAIGAAATTIAVKEEELKKLEEKYGKAAIDAVRDGSAGEREAKKPAKARKPGEKLSDSVLRNIVYATAKRFGWHTREDYEMHYLDPEGYGGRFDAHTIQLGGSVGRVGVSYSKYSTPSPNTSKTFAESHCKAQKRDGYITKIIKVGSAGGTKYDACYYYRNGSSKINNTSIHLMIGKYRLFFDSEDLYWLRADPVMAINALLANFLISY